MKSDELNQIRGGRGAFACKCGCGFNKVSEELIRLLSEASLEAGTPFTLSSGCRCEKHNAKVGGVPSSAHLLGLAADIACSDSDFEKVLTALKKRFVRVGISRKRGFIHVDIDSSKPKSVWNYDE